MALADAVARVEARVEEEVLGRVEGLEARVGREREGMEVGRFACTGLIDG